jgi:hypothetical protein
MKPFGLYLVQFILRFKHLFLLKILKSISIFLYRIADVGLLVCNASLDFTILFPFPSLKLC